jgi:hypothetical protein
MFLRATNGWLVNADKIDAFLPTKNNGKFFGASQALDELCREVGEDVDELIFDESEVKKVLKVK